ncbi:hypothetical protein [Natrinema gelatinilyticum]|uniref:hypothetical protein n=1 Tax=Natrinema gelatinilyticum TaxID=2961571 RepID=UPI003CE59B5B
MRRGSTLGRAPRRIHSTGTATSDRSPTDVQPRSTVRKLVCLTDGDGTGSGGTFVSVRTNDGVFLISDTRTSRGTIVSSEGVRKITQIHPAAAMGSTDDLAQHSRSSARSDSRST